MLQTRLIFGPIMVALAIAAFYADQEIGRLAVDAAWVQWVTGQPTFPAGVVIALIIGAAVGVSAWELTEICKANNLQADRGVMLTTVLGCLAITFALADAPEGRALRVTASFAVFMCLASMLQHSRRHDPEGAVAASASAMFALVFLGLLPSFYFWMRQEHSAWVVCAVMLIAKSCDIGAFFTGRAIGRHKLAAWLSPGKTWEGFIGGLVTSAAVAMGLAVLGDWTQSISFSLPFAAFFGAAMGVAGHAGDLAVSLLKRDAGMKDASDTIPGFGGALDVIDSLLGSAPVAYWLLRAAA